MVWKKALICAIMILLLVGCGKNDEPAQGALDLRRDLTEAGGCLFLADIRADIGEKTYRFSVSCDYTTGKDARVEVLQPEEIAGIAAAVSGDGASVEFDGMALDFGRMANGQLSAMESLWLLPECWNRAYISCAGKDEELLRVTYLEGYGEEEIVVDTWLDGDGIPVHGEITYDGVRCLTLDISQFQLKG